MCGIAGMYGVVSRERIEWMIDSEKHRGPDDCGIYIHEPSSVALGHQRLSIIDLSPLGHQPMSWRDGRYWIVYNGEIYNFLELKAQLIASGYRFQSNSDTEVILASYEKWGTGFLERLRGMFAFALWDAQEKVMLLARDRFGIKPLYWAQSNGVFIFASEIRSLVASQLCTFHLDKQAVWDYLSLASILPPRTIVSEIQALLPGHYILLNGGEVKIRRYWDLVENSLDQASPRPASYPEAVEELRAMLDEVARLHMIADVPVGAFLSGGVDSTTIVGLMSQYVSQPIHTFSLGFRSGDLLISELPWAEIAARQFGTDHHELVITSQEVRRQWEQLIRAYDQPSGDGLNSYFVSQYARSGVKVSLSGLGGDELFAGYPQFKTLAQRKPRLHPLDCILSPAYLKLRDFLPSRVKGLGDGLCLGGAERYYQSRCLYSEKGKEELINRSWCGSWTPSSTPSNMRIDFSLSLDPVQMVSFYETKGYMAHTLLRDVDNLSMAHSLEVRVPFLDHLLAQYVFSLPYAYKLHRGVAKRILLDAARDLLPGQVITRPKEGFRFPIREWVAGDLAPLVKECLLSSSQSIFDAERLGKMVVGSKQVDPMIIWSIFILLGWLDQNQSVVV